MEHTLLSSPLQGFTDFRFRNTFHKYFGGIDTFYAPYIRLNGKLEIKPAYQRDLDPKNNQDIEVIPQIMTNSAAEFLFVVDYVQRLGYEELNWNLGCPYPMVTKRGMGSGLISDFSKIDAILDEVHTKSNIKVSMKMRMGYDNPTEILDTLPILDKYPLKNIAIHARIGKQLYKGGVDLDSFQKCLDQTQHKLYYNGDITTVSGFKQMAERYPSIDHWMIGRGILMDPFLPQMIRQDTEVYPADRVKILSKFHDVLYQEYIDALSGPKHIIMKMFHFWEYFAVTFESPSKVIKRVKKAKNLRAYDLAVAENFKLEFRR